MRVELIRDRERIERFLRRQAAAHVYAIADLDDELWHGSRWFAALREPGGPSGRGSGEIEAICLLLEGLALPIVYAVCPAGDEATRSLLEVVRPELPDRFFYNFAPGLVAALGAGFRIDAHGTYRKMQLADDSACARVEADGVVPLGPADFDELRAFLDVAYLPHEKGGLFFDARMLASHCYRGVRESGRLVAVGGVHVYSPLRSVAGIGNVVTLPDRRGRGLARRTSAAVVRALRTETSGSPAIETIGLNVSERNEPALRCYRGLGFRFVCAYEEGIAERRSRAS